MCCVLGYQPGVPVPTFIIPWLQNLILAPQSSLEKMKKQTNKRTKTKQNKRNKSKQKLGPRTHSREGGHRIVLKFKIHPLFKDFHPNFTPLFHENQESLAVQKYPFFHYKEVRVNDYLCLEYLLKLISRINTPIFPFQGGMCLL